MIGMCDVMRAATRIALRRESDMEPDGILQAADVAIFCLVGQTLIRHICYHLARAGDPDLLRLPDRRDHNALGLAEQMIDTDAWIDDMLLGSARNAPEY